MKLFIDSGNLKEIEALVPIVIMVGYLLVARKLGAFEHI